MVGYVNVFGGYGDGGGNWYKFCLTWMDVWVIMSVCVCNVVGGSENTVNTKYL